MIDYNKSSIQLALDMVNSRLNSSLRPRDVRFEDVKYLEEGFFNTSAKIVPIPGSGYQDPAVIQYDRINIASLFRGMTVVVQPAYQKIVSDYLQTVNDKYGLALTSEDIVDGVIPPTEPPFKLTVKIQDSNPAFYGQFELLISDERKSIKNMVDEITFSGIPYPTNDPNKIQGPLYFYGSDWTELKRTFQLYNTHDKLDKTFLDQINLYDTNIWVDRKVKSEFNLHQAEVLYHGKIEFGKEYTRRQDYTHVFVVKLDEEYCSNVTGYLVFHYNDQTV